MNESRGMPITVVVPTKDRPDLLDGCLRALRPSMRGSDELIVVDSASASERTRETAEAYGALCVRCDRPGVARARNAGWRRATREIVAFVDDDVRVEPAWADAVAVCFGRFPEIAFLTGRVGVPADEEPEYSVALMADDEPFWIDAAARRDPGHGANLAARRDALEAVRGFDEALGSGGRYRAAEDKDFIDRLIQAGMLGRYEPKAAALHTQWRTRPELLRLNWSYGLGSGVRIAKLLKTDRRRALTAAYDAFWNWGLVYLWNDAKRRLKFLSMVDVVRMIGMLAGVLWGLPGRVRDGHFAS